MASSVNNIAINPVNVYWKMEQTETWDFTGLTKAGLDAKAFQFYSALNAAAHYIWFDGTGATVDPAIAAFTQHEVTIGTDTPTAIATAVAAVVTAITGFDATSSGPYVTVKRTAAGETTESFDAAGGDASDIVYTLTRRGRDMDLGLLQGDVECNFQPSNFILTSHQTGLTPLAALNQGFETLECTTTMLETHKANLKELYKIYGGVVQGGTSEVFGVGTASQGKNMMIEAGRLVLKPVNASDDTGNFNFMLAVPVPETLTFSGENPRVLSLTWQGFVDRDFNSKFNAIAIGDIYQTGL
jgi:hypothetical protein